MQYYYSYSHLFLQLDCVGTYDNYMRKKISLPSKTLGIMPSKPPEKEKKSLGMMEPGNLRHITMKLGKTFGLKITVISTSPKRENKANEYLGETTSSSANICMKQLSLRITYSTQYMSTIPCILSSFY